MNSPTLETKPQGFNTTMLLMQCIGIIAVVFGHADIGGDDIPNLLNFAFPYYSWHMPFFVFISGYFFNRTKTFYKYIGGKLKTHLLPAFIVNLVSGVFSYLLKAYEITNYGQDITLKSLFVTPFTTGYQFYINVSLWFVFALVVIEIVACLMDRLARGKGDVVFLIVTFFASLYCSFKTYYDFDGTRGEYYNAVLRFGFLMFFFWLGVCYRKYGEKALKKFINYKTSIVIFIVQALILELTNSYINVNVRDMRLTSISVPNGFWVAVVSPIVATVFFLGVCYSLAPYLKTSKPLIAFGRGTKYVMYYHQLIFVLFSLLFGVLKKLNLFVLDGFLFEKMKNSNYYTGGNLAVTCVIAVLALILPVVVCRFIDKQKLYLRVILYTVLAVGVGGFITLSGAVLN